MKKTIKNSPHKSKNLRHLPSKGFELGASNKDFVAYYNVYIDGKKVARRKSESYHAGFYWLLYFSGGGATSNMRDVHFSGYITGIEMTNYGLTLKHNISDPFFKYLEFPNSPEWNMLLTQQARKPYQVDLGHALAYRGRYDTVLPGTYGLPEAEWPDITDAKIYRWSRTSGHMYGSTEMIVGNNKDPININQFFFDDTHLIADGDDSGQLLHGNVDVFERATSKEKSFFKLSRTFSNQSGDVIDIDDISIVFKRLEDTPYDWCPIYIRDILGSPISVPPDSTLTIEYEIGSEFEVDTTNTDIDGTNGGYLSSYVQGIRDTSAGIGAFTAGLVFPLQQTHHRYFPTSGDTGDDDYFIQFYRGLIVGTNNEYVSMTDEIDIVDDSQIFDLIRPKIHGGPLEYGESELGPVTKDIVNNEAYFDIGRKFTNTGNDSVVIKEVGLYSGMYGLVIRYALHEDDWITILPNTVKEIYFRIKFTE